MTHSLSTVAVFVAAAAVFRMDRAVLAGVATGLVLHFARDIAEGYPGCGLLAASGHFLDGELPVVPGNDCRVHGRPARANYFDLKKS